MEFLILGIVLLFSTILLTGVTIFSVWFLTRKYTQGFSKYIQQVNYHSQIQKQNTEKLIKIMDGAFVQPKVQNTPNQAVKIDTSSVEFSENTPLELNTDVKFEVEGGDAGIPPGYSPKN